jgi:putative nucleotidyltransferase with HDIG domain
MSFGVAGRVQPRQTATEIMHAADVAVYQAKLAGRNRTVLSAGAKAGEPTGLAPTTTVTVPVSSDRTDESYKPAEVVRHPGRSTSPRWNLAFTILLAALAVTGSALTWQPVTVAMVTGIAVFMGLALLTEWWAVELYSRNTSISTTGVVLLSGTALFGPLAGLAISTTFVLVNVIRQRRPFHTVVFNLSQSVITSLLGHGVFLIVAQFPAHWAISLVATLVASMLGYVFSTGAIGLRMSLASGRSLASLWGEHFGWLWPYYIAFGVVAFGVSHSYVISGWLGVAVMLVPVLLLRFSQSQYISRTTIMVSELRQKNAELVRTSQQLTEVNEGLIKALSQAIDLRDPFVEGHSQHVARYAVLIARELGLSDTRIENVRRAALLHDLGKLGIPDSILLKTERLTTEEYELVKRHASLGAEMIERLTPLAHLAPFIRHHHERFDGCGYPEHLSADAIPLEARILSVADTVEAMASDRPYRPAQLANRIMNELRANLGTQFDPVVVAAFERVVARHGTTLIVNSAYHLARLVPELTSSLRTRVDAPAVPPVIVATGRQFRH